MSKKAMFTVKHRTRPKCAVIVVYNEVTGRHGKVLVSEPIRDDFSIPDLVEAARRLVPKAEGYEVTLPVGVNL